MTPNASRESAASRVWRRMLLAAALTAGAVSLYLTIVSFSLRGTPWGCGPGSGCEEVLRSRWGTLLGVPVGAAAVPVQLLLVGLALAARPSQAAARVLLVLAGTLLSAALWFVGLQAIVLRAFCPWCLADHALGALAAISAIGWVCSSGVLAGPAGPAGDMRSAPRESPGGMAADANDDPFAESASGRSGPPGDPFAADDLAPSALRVSPTAAAGAPDMACPARRVAPPLAAGVLLTAALAGVQYLVPPAAGVARLNADSGDDSGPGPSRTLSLLDGRLSLQPHDWPCLGNPDAEHVLVVLADYACPHCRATHSVLSRLVDESEGQLAVLVAPVPLNADCNPAIEETEPRFVHSCDLARLALAVRRASPGGFAEFDHWLFAPETPRTADEARAKAVELTDAAALDAALADAATEAQLQAGVNAYRHSGAEHLPILLSPGMAPMVGRASGDDALRTMLIDELKLRGPAAE